MASFQDRVVGAIRLRADVFEDVEHDRAATGQAALVVVAVALAGGIARFWYLGITGLVMTLVLSLIGWVIGSALLLFVGTKIFPGKNTEADMGQMLRTLGFAQAAGLFGILGIIPFLGYLIEFLIWIWILVAMVFATRQALDYDDTMKAVVVCLFTWALMLVVQIVGRMLGFGAGIPGALG